MAAGTENQDWARTAPLEGGVVVEKKTYAISLFSHDQQTLVLPLDSADAQKVANLASHFADVVVGRDFGPVVEVRPLQIAPLTEDPDGHIRYCGRNYTLGRPITAKDPNPQAKAGTP